MLRYIKAKIEQFKNSKYSTTNKNSNNRQQHTTGHKNIPPNILNSSSEATVSMLHRVLDEKMTKGVFRII